MTEAERLVYSRNFFFQMTLQQFSRVAFLCSPTQAMSRCENTIPRNHRALILKTIILYIKNLRASFIYARRIKHFNSKFQGTIIKKKVFF